jgi:hypothetical protein
MNNFINVARKLQRNSLERGIISSAGHRLPNIEQYISAHRFPTLPKIVVYSSVGHLDTLLSK